jgi:hypothetical protein
MNKRWKGTIRRRGAAAVMLLGFATAIAGGICCASESHEPTQAASPAIVAAMVRCERVTTGECFSPRFLVDARRRAGLDVADEFADVTLTDEAIYEHPLAILAGDGALLLTRAERETLAHYLAAGGFLIVSANCTSAAFDDSFRELAEELWPDAPLERLADDHPMFDGVFAIEALRAQKVGGDPHLLGLHLDGRLVLVYSPNGLSATAELPRECCCCGGDELANARPVLVNLLTWVLAGREADETPDEEAE